MSFVCPDCSRAFGSQRGLTLHRRRAHEEAFHAENLPKQRVKARWDPEELCMLANLEISLDERPPGDRRGINQILIGHHPGRTLESIKCARKSQRYRDLIQELRNQRSAAPAVSTALTWVTSVYGGPGGCPPGDASVGPGMVPAVDRRSCNAPWQRRRSGGDEQRT